MLSTEDNKLLTQTGPGTPMGELWRRFWFPVMLSEDLPAPDCVPHRVRVLNEDLIAFRDTEGRVGLVDAYCPHRGAPIFFGRNEENGLRCVYHGWKFDFEGTCVEMPNTPEGDTYKDKVRIKSYPTVDKAGFIWAYMGPPEKVPPLPGFEFMELPKSHYECWQLDSDCNWLQSLEGGYDPSHGMFLHSSNNRTANPSDQVFRSERRARQDNREPPRYVMCEETEYGVISATVRENLDGEQLVNISHMCLPGFVPVPIAPNRFNRPGMGYMRVRVPIDDVTSTVFRIRYDPNNALSDEFVNEYRNGDFLQPKMQPGTHKPINTRDNDYGVDRFLQKNYNFTGIREFSIQDVAVIENQRGPIMDRTQEHLVRSDTMIINVRKALIKAVQNLQAGKEPTLPFKPELFNINRPNQVIVPEGSSIEDTVHNRLAEVPMALARG